MKIYSQAPLRLSFSGGGTDVEPYLSDYGGLVVSATINKRVHATLQPNPGAQINVKSLDYGRIVEFLERTAPPFTGEFSIIRAILYRVCAEKGRTGMDIVLRSDVRPGTGLGASSALAVALVALLKKWQGAVVKPQEIAELAYQAERLDAKIRGGKQDQYAAAYGDFNLIEFQREGTKVRPLNIKPSRVAELQNNMLLCYTGTTRYSADIITAQAKRVEQGGETVLRLMDSLKEIARAIAEALLNGRLDDFGALLHEAWLSKRQLAPQISNPALDELYTTVRKYGVLGGKISGAGGGGYMFFFCPANRKPIVAELLEQWGARVEDFAFVIPGVQTWTTP